jgi:hypothetical protein
MEDPTLVLVQEVHRKESERLRAEGKLKLPFEPAKPATIPYTQLRPFKPDEVFYLEWNTYLREVGRLLAEGLEGKWLLVKGESILGVFDTMQQADSSGLSLVLEAKIEKPYMLRQVLAEEPILKLRGYNLPWRHYPFQPARTACP